MLDYLGCLYSMPDSEETRPGSSQDGSLPTERTEVGQRSAMETKLLGVYRRVLDEHGAAAGP